MGVTMPAPATRSVSGGEDPVGRFFTTLAQPGQLATFANQTATLRFDVMDAGAVERWHLSVHNGDVTVTRHNRSADAVATIQRRHLEAIVTGRLNATAAMLRGLLSCEGSMAALMMFQRCLPGPPGSVGSVPPISSAQVMARRRAT